MCSPDYCDITQMCILQTPSLGLRNVQPISLLECHLSHSWTDHHPCPLLTHSTKRTWKGRGSYESGQGNRKQIAHKTLQKAAQQQIRPGGKVAQKRSLIIFRNTGGALRAFLAPSIYRSNEADYGVGCNVQEQHLSPQRFSHTRTRPGVHFSKVSSPTPESFRTSCAPTVAEIHAHKPHPILLLKPVTGVHKDLPLFPSLLLYSLFPLNPLTSTLDKRIFRSDQFSREAEM